MAPRRPTTLADPTPFPHEGPVAEQPTAASSDLFEMLVEQLDALEAVTDRLWAVTAAAQRHGVGSDDMPNNTPIPAKSPNGDRLANTLARVTNTIQRLDALAESLDLS